MIYILFWFFWIFQSKSCLKELKYDKPDRVTYVCNASTWEAGGLSQFEASLVLRV